MMDFVVEPDPAGLARIKVIGVGGGGCNAVDSMYDIGLPSVEFYVTNSDIQALKRSKCPNRIQIGAKQTHGRGCGADPKLGEACMMDAKEELTEMLSGADIAFVTAGLGGGTGTGGAPVVAKLARDMGILTVGVVTRPFGFEGARRMKSSDSGLERMREACDTVIVINNDRLLDVVGPKVPMKESFKIADHVLSQAVQSIADLVATPGLINVDFNDVRAIMSGRGGAVMGVGMGKGENRALEAVKKATSSPLLDKIVIDGATGVLICITGGADMTLAEVNEATQLVKEAADPDAEIIFGAVIDETLTDMMRVTIIATGFPEDVQRRQVSGTASKPAASGFLSAPLRPAEKPTLSQAIRSSERPAPAAPVAQAADSLDGVALFDAIEEKKEAPKPAPAAPPRADSLRSTLERMISEQGNGNGNGGARPAAPRGNGNGAPAAPAAPSHPAVRTASSSRTDVAVKAAAAAEEVAVPAVKMFDAAEADKDEKSDFDTPAFLRRRRSLFE